MPIFYRWMIAVLACVSALPAHAGDPQRGIAGVADRKATVNFAELARQEARVPLAPRTPKVVHSPMPGPKEPGDRVSPLRDDSTSAAPAEAGPSPLSPATASSFQAVLDDNTAIPPDTHGAVGPNHLMTVLNTQVRIQNRTGVVLSTVSMDSFWASLGSPNAFDPKILYDPYGGRWIFAAAANGNSTASAVLIGVSQTSDPTGAWNLFSVDVIGTANWADFPSVGFNKDWIVVNMNMFTVNASPSFVQSNIWVFTKASLYNNGGPSAPFRLFTEMNSSTLVPAMTYDATATLATLYLVDVFNSSTGTLRIGTITGAVGAEIYTASTSLPSATS